MNGWTGGQYSIYRVLFGAYLLAHFVLLSPLFGWGTEVFSGRGVLRLDRHDPNLGSLIEISTHGGARAVIVQRFLREVAEGNKRIFVLAGEPAGAVYRYPQAGDFRIGDPAAQAPVTARDREICARLAPTLRRHGIHLAGLDVIGPFLIEVNVTSVGALRKADALLGWTLCSDLLHSVLGTQDSTPENTQDSTPEKRRSA